MPLEVYEATDSLTSLIKLRTSAIFEMLISLHTLLYTDRHQDWAAHARASLPPGLLDEIADFLETLGGDQTFYESAIDYDHHEDVPGFIAYVRDMDPARFVWYALGRVLPLEDVATLLDDPRALGDVLAAGSSEYEHYYERHLSTLPLDLILSDVPGLQAQLADLWQRYWDGFFAAEVESFRPHWESAQADKELLLARDGGESLFNLVADDKPLPPPLPAHVPYTEIVCIPVYLAPRSKFMFYGYGNVTVLYDSRRTEARVAELEQVRDEVVNAAKALGDGTRLRILRSIAAHEGTMHGKMIAASTQLSPSVVSRHLARLREAGLISEVPRDNRVIAYRLEREAIRALPDKLTEYLFS